MRFWRYALSVLLAMRPLGAEAQGIDKNFVERIVTVDGSTYRYRVYVPSGWSKSASWPVILSLHGGGGYGNDGIKQVSEGLAPAIRRHPERFPALAVFPQIPANGMPGWQGLGGRIALAALDQTIDEFHGDALRITLTGLSIGGNGAWYLAYHYPQRFAGLLVICGFITERTGTMYPIVYPSLVPGVKDPSATVAQKLVHIPTWIFHGDVDRTVAVEQSRGMARALRALSAPVQYTELAGIDHDAWNYAYNQPEVAKWLLQQRRSAACCRN